jgi:hypothetical protein
MGLGGYAGGLGGDSAPAGASGVPVRGRSCEVPARLVISWHGR